MDASTQTSDGDPLALIQDQQANTELQDNQVNRELQDREVEGLEDRGLEDRGLEDRRLEDRGQPGDVPTTEVFNMETNQLIDAINHYITSLDLISASGEEDVIKLRSYYSKAKEINAIVDNLQAQGHRFSDRLERVIQICAHKRKLSE